MLVIATAWIVYRPILGVLLIAAAIGCLVLLKRLHTKRAPTSTPAPA